MASGQEDDLAESFRLYHFVVLPGFVSPTALSPLTRWAAAADWHTMSPRVGLVTQRKEEAVVASPDGAEPLISRIQQLAAGLRVPSWTPNEFTLNRYVDATSLISSHRDHLRYQGIVAILTLQGAADMVVSRTRDGRPCHRQRVAPGELVLLRASDASGPDQRPYHAVGPPLAGQRISLTLRQLAAGNFDP